MKITTTKIGMTSLVGGGLVAAVLGLAAPAQADLAHNLWANQQNHTAVSVPQVDTSVHH